MKVGSVHVENCFYNSCWQFFFFAPSCNPARPACPLRSRCRWKFTYWKVLTLFWGLFWKFRGAKLQNPDFAKCFLDYPAILLCKDNHNILYNSICPNLRLRKLYLDGQRLLGSVLGPFGRKNRQVMFLTSFPRTFYNFVAKGRPRRPVEFVTSLLTNKKLYFFLKHHFWDIFWNFLRVKIDITYFPSLLIEHSIILLQKGCHNVL